MADNQHNNFNCRMPDVDNTSPAAEHYLRCHNAVKLCTNHSNRFNVWQAPPSAMLSLAT